MNHWQTFEGSKWHFEKTATLSKQRNFLRVSPSCSLCLSSMFIISSVCVCDQSLSCVRLFATPWAVAHQSPLSVEFSREEHCSGLPFPSPGDLPDPGIKPTSPAFAGGFCTTAPSKKPLIPCGLPTSQPTSCLLLQSPELSL